MFIEIVERIIQKAKNKSFVKILKSIENDVKTQKVQKVKLNVKMNEMTKWEKELLEMLRNERIERQISELTLQGCERENKFIKSFHNQNIVLRFWLI